MRFSPSRRCAVPALLALAAVLAAAAPLHAATDGVYNGTVGGRPFSLTVAGNRITAWSAKNLACPTFTIVEVSISNTSCNISASNTFTCGNLGCQIGSPNMRISGSFSGNTVTGTFDIDLDPDAFNPCCSLRNLAFTATRSGSGGGVPAVPSGLTATALDADRIQLEWNDNANNETEYRVEVRQGSGAFQELSPALPANSEGAIVSNLDPGTAYTFRVRARNASGFSPYSNEATATTFGSTGPCIPSSTVLCLQADRFRVSATFQTPQGQSGNAQVVELTDETGYLWFFSAQNVEAVVKVINACAFTAPRFWVFAGGLTNVRTVITVTDTQTGATKTYINPQNTPFQPVQDTNAFATCP